MCLSLQHGKKIMWHCPCLRRHGWGRQRREFIHKIDVKVFNQSISELVRKAGRWLLSRIWGSEMDGADQIQIGFFHFWLWKDPKMLLKNHSGPNPIQISRTDATTIQPWCKGTNFFLLPSSSGVQWRRGRWGRTALQKVLWKVLLWLLWWVWSCKYLQPLGSRGSEPEGCVCMITGMVALFIELR